MAIDDKITRNSSREVRLLGTLTGDYDGELDPPMSRIEYLLNKLVENGVNGGSGTGGNTGTGTGGTTNYNKLTNKPQINGVTLSGKLTTADLHISDITDYDDLIDRPKINGVVLEGNKLTSSLSIPYADLINKPKINGVEVVANTTLPVGVTDYDDLGTTRPQINGVTLTGNKTTAELGIDIPTVVSKLTNDAGYTTTKAVNDLLAIYETQADLANALQDYYTKTQMDQKMSSVFTYKGETIGVDSLSTIASPAVGDVYRVLLTATRDVTYVPTTDTIMQTGVTYYEITDGVASATTDKAFVSTKTYYTIDRYGEYDPIDSYVEANITAFESGVTYYEENDDGDYVATTDTAYDSSKTYYVSNFQSGTTYYEENDDGDYVVTTDTVPDNDKDYYTKNNGTTITETYQTGGYSFYAKTDAGWDNWGSSFVDLTNYLTRNDTATTTQNGVMSAADKVKLNSLSSNTGDENTIETISVNGVQRPIDAAKNVDISVPIQSISLDGSAVMPDSTGHVALTSPTSDIKSISVNSVPSTVDSSGNVDISVPEIQSISVNTTTQTIDSNGNVNIDIPVTGIKVNGTAVTPDSNHTVDITTSTSKIQSISVNGTAVTPDSNGNVDIVASSGGGGVGGYTAGDNIEFTPTYTLTTDTTFDKSKTYYELNSSTNTYSVTSDTSFASGKSYYELTSEKISTSAYTLTQDEDNSQKIILTKTSDNTTQTVELPIHNTAVEGYPTPVGTIIPFMGKTAPENYLICDGTVYNIADYAELSTFIKAQFGSVNFFGGDGSTTFAVPDLRGEFIRGTGTNSHENQGSGADIGVHQDATKQSNMFGYSNGYIQFHIDYDQTDGSAQNADHTFSNGKFVNAGKGVTGSDTKNGYFTARPTNTSVLFCIKYRSDYVINNVYSTDEVVVGRWIDGKPVYRKVISNPTSDLTVTPNEWVDTGFTATNIDRLVKGCIINTNNSSYHPVYCYIEDNSVKVLSARNITLEYGTSYLIILEYTKTTDDADTMVTPVSYTEYDETATDEEVDELIAYVQGGSDLDTVATDEEVNELINAAAS